MVTTKKKAYVNRQIKYNKDWQVGFEGELPVFLPEKAYSSVVSSHTKRYHNCLYLLAGLSACARNVMDFITENMDDQNMISTNSYFRDKFREEIARMTIAENPQTKYSDASVKKALAALTDKGLIRRINRGYSLVNPIFFWKNDDSNRDASLKIELEFNAGANTKLAALQAEYGKQVEIRE